MPKVTPQYLTARRRHILDAARACFVRQGFHATSVDDVLRAAGVSAGALYHYFSSKEELVRGIVEDALIEIDAAIQSAAGGDHLADVIDELLDTMDRLEAERGLGGLAVHIWAESLRNPELSAMLSDAYATTRLRTADALRHSGIVSAGSTDREVEQLAQLIIGLAPAYLIQRVVLGPAAADLFRHGLRKTTAYDHARRRANQSDTS